MFNPMGQSNPEDLGNGGTIDGDIVITGDLNVSGGIGLTLSEVIQGTSTIDVTNTEALLVRKNDDGGDVFIVDTTNSRVGINKTPTNSLHLDIGNGTAEFGKGITIETGDGSYSANRGGMLEFHNEDVIIAGIRAERPTLGGHRGELQFFTHNSSSGNTYGSTFLERMRIDSNGRVGIGEVSPDQLLHLKTANGSEMVLQRTAGTTSGLLGAIHFGNADVDEYLASIRSVQDGSTSSAYLAFETEATGGAKAERMRITSAGNVGIGTASPAELLHVNGGHLEVQNGGNTNVIINSASGSDGSLYFQEGGGMKARVYNDASADALVLTDGADTTTLTLSGTNATFANTAIFANNKSINFLNTSGAEKAIISFSSSNITKIGDASNSGTLQLNSGNATFAGNLGINTDSGGWGLNVKGADANVFKVQASDGNTLSFLQGTNGDAAQKWFADGNVTKVLINTNGSSYFTGGSLGVGTASPSALIQIGSNDVANTGLRITNQGAVDAKSIIGFGGSGTQPISAIGGIVESATANTAGGIYFSTRTSTNNDAPTEKMRITGAGDVQINGGTNYSQLQIISTGAEGGIKFVDSGGTVDGYIYATAGCIGFLDENTAQRFKIDANSRISLSNNDGGAENTVFGFQAFNATSTNKDKNSAFGYRSLFSYAPSSDGDGRNTAVGYNSGRLLTTGTGCVFLGADAEASANSGVNQIVIGDSTTGQANNSVTLGNADVTAVYMAQDSGASIFCGDILSGRASAGSTGNGHSIRSADSVIFSRDASGETMQVCRNADNGQFIQFRANGTTVGDIKNTGGTVSLTGFSGCHESSSPDTLEVGMVVSTIDEEHSENHAKVEISNSVGDKRVYGVVSDLEGLDGSNVTIASVGISSIKVTGSCVGGDLLESNGDGTAKVQSDDIIKSKTIGKVTMGNSTEEVKMVSCVLYCG